MRGGNASSSFGRATDRRMARRLGPKEVGSLRSWSLDTGGHGPLASGVRPHPYPTPEGTAMPPETALLESRALRDSVIERTDALDKVKILTMLPDGVHVTTRIVAAYFEVREEA